MTANELNTMVKAMTSKYNKISSRCELQNSIYYLHMGLKAIGRVEDAETLIKLYQEIDSVDTGELVTLGTF